MAAKDPEGGAQGPAKAGPSYFTCFCVVLCCLNVLLTVTIRQEIDSGREKLDEWSAAVETCSGADGEAPLAISRLLANEFIGIVRSPSSASVERLTRWASQYITKKFSHNEKPGTRDWVDCSAAGGNNTNSSSRSVPLLPLNLFQVLNDVIIANFTEFMNETSVFFYDFSEGVYAVSSTYHEKRFGDALQGISGFFRITANHVKPLSSKHIAPDDSVVGNILTNVPPDLYQTLSDKDTYERTAIDCVVLAARLFAMDWDTEFVKHNDEGESRVVQIDGGANLEIFGRIRDYCNALYLGAQL